MRYADSGQQPGKKLATPGKDVHAGAAKISGNGMRQAVEDKEKAIRMRDLLKRSVVALSALASNESAAVCEKLADFKKAVNKATAIEEMEASLSALRDTIARSEQWVPGEAENRSEPTECGTVYRRGGQAPEEDLNGPCKELQSIFVGLIAEFDHDFGEEYSLLLSRLREKIERCSRIEDIVGIKDDIITFAQTYNNLINEERSLVTNLISEIGEGLLEVERQYLDSISQTGQNQSENIKFNNILESHVEEMKRSAQLSNTLAQFRGLVMSRLASIRTALEEKRRSEALRQERLKQEMESLNQNLNRMKKEVDQVREKRKALEKEVLIDPLTGVANRRALRERLKNELCRFQRYRQFFSILLFDIDNFKAINDQYGHWAGDRCLKEIIKRIRPILRETDFFARWGGDEFVVIFPGTDLESAAAVAERLRKLIQNTRFVYHKQEISLTVSVGVTEIDDTDPTQEMIFNRVDKAMYKAKKDGRNMVTAI